MPHIVPEILQQLQQTTIYRHRLFNLVRYTCDTRHDRKRWAKRREHIMRVSECPGKNQLTGIMRSSKIFDTITDPDMYLSRNVKTVSVKNTHGEKLKFKYSVISGIFARSGIKASLIENLIWDQAFLHTLKFKIKGGRRYHTLFKIFLTT